jgi:hypothetical protein
VKKFARSLTGLSLLVACSWITAVRAQSQENSPTPQVLQITREYTKPGKAGMVHDKSESAFVQAMARAKWPTHYVGMTSLSGKQRALFLTQYASFEAWEKDNTATASNAALSAALDRAGMADGELLDSMDSGVFIYHDEMSLRSVTDVSHMRYVEISSYNVRPGHDAEWNEVVKMVKAAYEKAEPEQHWAMYELVYGGEGGRFLVLTARKSLAEIDRGFQEDKQFQAALGENGMKKLLELYGAAVESSDHQLFAFNPHMSYVEDAWIKADPDFWKPKPEAAPGAKSATTEKKANP